MCDKTRQNSPNCNLCVFIKVSVHHRSGAKSLECSLSSNYFLGKHFLMIKNVYLQCSSGPNDRIDAVKMDGFVGNVIVLCLYPATPAYSLMCN